MKRLLMAGLLAIAVLLLTTEAAAAQEFTSTRAFGSQDRSDLFHPEHQLTAQLLGIKPASQTIYN